MVTQLKSLRQSNFFWSLIGFNIAQTQNTSTNPSYMIWHDRISTFWLEQGQPSGSMMEKAAWSLVGQKEQAEDFLRELPPEVQVSLGVAFNAEGYPDTGCALLERYLKHVDSTRPPAYKPTRSVVYGHLFAELVNNRNALHDGKRLISWGFKLSRLRDEEKLGARLDSINIKLSVADTHTILADYDTAIDLLHQVLSVRNLQPYIHIVSTLRLNKIGRRIDRFESHIGEYLKAASLLVIEEEVEVQKEFLAELAATLAHVKHIEVDNPYHSDLCETVHKTIYLYEDHPILRDDWRLQKIKSMMGKMLPVGWSPNSAKQPLLEQVTADPVNTATKPMFDEIFVHLVPSKFDDRTEYFLPEDSVSKILNRESVRGAMKIESLPENDKLVDFILTKAPKVFLISIFSGLEEETLHLAMTSVQEANLTDVYLPISDLFDFQMPEWTPVMANNFYQQQWKFLAPVFTPDQFYYLFDPLCILPVIEKGKELKVGGISQVTKVEIHKAHFKANDAEIVGHQLFALKTICQADIWAGDMEAMNSAHSLKHPNIVKPIAAFQIGLIGAVNRYFMLEWADGGNLRDLWMSHPQPTRTPDLIKDVVRQLFDLTRALSAVHADHTRHGGLKPENILRFTNREDTLIGTLKLGDWGFARRQMNVTRLRDDVTTTKHETRRYEPPESDERSEVYIDRSRLSDVWAMGCIILEFMVWLLYGEEGLNKFDRDVSRSSSEDHVFYQLSKDVSGIEFKVKDAVAEWMDMMSRHTDCKSNTAMGDLLIIVKTKLLVVDLPRSAMEHSSGSLEAPVIRFEPPVEPGGVALNQVTALPLARADQRQRRAQASDLQKGLESILQREATNDSYWPTSCTNSSKANDDEDDEDDEGDFSRDGPRFPQPEGSLDRKKFKCPFYKYHPALYRNCERLRMASISYVTQHILRRHVLKQCTMDVQETSQSTDGNPIYLPRTTDPDKIVFYCPKCRDEFRGPGADVRSERHPACEAKSTAQTGVLLPAEFERLKKEVTATSGNDNKWEKIWTTLFPGTSMPTQYSEAEIVAPVGVDARPHNTFQYYPFAGVPIETHHHDPPQIFDPRMPDFMQVPDPYLGDEGFFNFFQDHHWDMANNTGNLDYAPSHIPNSAPTDETPTRRPGRFDPDFIQNSPFPNNAWWAHDNYHGTQ
ncbi:hypothetical protein NW762_014170 [Fusarium torreyae]|uniref:Protein kinase domain-containing protein n=1 Tax=Fusarium torreyae TaxID=1237075 RepID=A0A9W8RKR1_9HYPO|nr:hypothetical protein NW762_014170 [Fusarium torreyae]